MEGNQIAFNYYSRLSRVKHYVDQHFSEDISLQKAARVAALEEKYFSAFFRKKTGICFRQWLAELRVNKAIEIIRQNDASITDVSLIVGFRDLRTFERAFKKCRGMTPRDFKRTVQST